MNIGSFKGGYEPPDDTEAERQDPVPTIMQQAIIIQTEGLPITPYQNKVKSKLYYDFHKKRIDALFEVVQSENQLVKAIREWWIEAWKLHNVEEEIRLTIQGPREIDKLKQEREKSIYGDKELQQLELEEKKLEHKTRIAELKNKLKKLEGGRDEEDDSVKIKREAEITKEKAKAVFDILESISAKEKEMKGRYNEDEAARIIEWAKELFAHHDII